MSIWKWIVAAGTVLSVTGIIALVWEQAVIDRSPFTGSAFERWETATLPLMLTALGLIVIVAALILRAVETRHPSN